jgi:hypothetical protein
MPLYVRGMGECKFILLYANDTSDSRMIVRISCSNHTRKFT